MDLYETVKHDQSKVLILSDIRSSAYFHFEPESQIWNVLVQVGFEGGYKEFRQPENEVRDLFEQTKQGELEGDTTSVEIRELEDTPFSRFYE